MSWVGGCGPHNDLETNVFKRVTDQQSAHESPLSVPARSISKASINGRKGQCAGTRCLLR